MENGAPVVAIVGATGVTGRRVARYAAEFGLRAVLVGRNRGRLQRLAEEASAHEVRVADVYDPAALRAAIGDSDVVVSCVAPFTRLGFPVAEAAVAIGADYVDTTGETGYCLHLLDRLDGPARESPARLVPAIGASSLPADFAAALVLALDLAELATATGLSFGYQVKDFHMSAGTIRFEIDILAARAPVVAGGRLRMLPPGGSVRRPALARTTTVTGHDVTGSPPEALPWWPRDPARAA